MRKLISGAIVGGLLALAAIATVLARGNTYYAILTAPDGSYVGSAVVTDSGIEVQGNLGGPGQIMGNFGLEIAGEALDCVESGPGGNFKHMGRLPPITIGAGVPVDGIFPCPFGGDGDGVPPVILFSGQLIGHPSR